MFSVDQILKELNNIDPQTNQLKNKSVPATSVQSKDPGVTTAPVTTVAADPQDGTTPGVSVSNKAVSKDSAQGLEASSTTKATTEASASQESAPKTSEEVKLDEKMLEALGKRLDPEKKTAPAVHNDLFLRWKEILKNGLPKEEREKIQAKYPTPENCLTLEPQKMNAEIKASLLEPLIKKDNRLVEKQQKVCLCLSALGPLISDLLKDKIPETAKMVAVLSDTARVLVDLQRDESLTRRLIITANINPALKETLNSTSMDEWLFGKNLEESLKTAKLIERSSKELKPVSKGNTGPKPKNSKVPPQQPPRARVKSGGGE